MSDQSNQARLTTQVTKKIVINRCFGGYGLSEAAVRRLRELGLQEAMDEILPGEMDTDGTIALDRYYFNSYYIGRRNEDSLRSHPLLVQVVEELGDKANGGAAELAIVEIPADVEYVIEEYDGLEHVAEKHRTWS